MTESQEVHNKKIRYRPVKRESYEIYTSELASLTSMSEKFISLFNRKRKGSLNGSVVTTMDTTFH